MIFGVQNYTWANIQSGKGLKVYVYRFVHKPPATGEYARYGAFHTAEVPYAYDNLQFVDRPWQPADHKLATIMSSYWANFAETGDPNGENLPVWNAYEVTGKIVMTLDEKPEARSIPDKEALDFLFKKMTGQ